MKKLFISTVLALLAVISVNAQTNFVVNGVTYVPITFTNPASFTLTNAISSGKSSGGWELTLGGGGETIDGRSYHGVDVSLSSNPFQSRPDVWIGVAQSAYWEPTFAGSTDLFVDWSQAILPSLLNDTLYLNIGWSGGILYDNDSSTKSIWRSGPEATLQYYVGSNAFIYAGVNYDVYRSDDEEGEFRWSFGVGLSF